MTKSKITDMYMLTTIKDGEVDQYCYTTVKGLVKWHPKLKDCAKRLNGMKSEAGKFMTYIDEIWYHVSVKGLYVSS